jgi:hypothetical protein
MQKLMLLFIYVIFCFNSFAQERTNAFKNVADKLIIENFSPSVYHSITCTTVTFLSAGTDGDRAFDYADVMDTIVSVPYIQFSYIFHSEKLNYDFDFDITVSKAKELFCDSIFLEEIPACIRLDQHCRFLSKDDAMKIAIKNSIAYPENMEASFYFNEIEEQYYWFVSSFSLNVNAPKKDLENNKYINAMTGKIKKVKYEPVR